MLSACQDSEFSMRAGKPATVHQVSKVCIYYGLSVLSMPSSQSIISAMLLSCPRMISSRAHLPQGKRTCMGGNHYVQQV